MLKSTLIVASVYGLLVLLVLGCQSKARDRFDGLTRVHDPATGAVVYESKSTNYAYAESVMNPQGDTTASATLGGAKSTAAGSWKADPIDWAAKNTGWLYIIGAIALIGGGVLAFVGKQKIAGGAVSAAGGVLIAAPRVIDQLGIMLLVAVGVLVAGGIAWVAVTLFRRKQAANIMPVVVKKLNEAMHADSAAKASTATREAVTAMRPVMPAVDREFEAQKK